MKPYTKAEDTNLRATFERAKRELGPQRVTERLVLEGGVVKPLVGRFGRFGVGRFGERK